MGKARLRMQQLVAGFPTSNLHTLRRIIYARTPSFTQSVSMPPATLWCYADNRTGSRMLLRTRQKNHRTDTRLCRFVYKHDRLHWRSPLALPTRLTSWMLALWPALVLLTAHNFCVVRSPVSFEQTTIESPHSRSSNRRLCRASRWCPQKRRGRNSSSSHQLVGTRWPSYGGNISRSDSSANPNTFFIIGAVATTVVHFVAQC